MKYKFFDKTRIFIVIAYFIVITAAAVVDLVFFWELGVVAIVGFIFAWVLCSSVLLRLILLMPTILICDDGIQYYMGKRRKREIKWEDLVEIKPYYKNKQKYYMIYAKDDIQPLIVQFRLNNAEFEKALKQFTALL